MEMKYTGKADIRIISPFSARVEEGDVITVNDKDVVDDLKRVGFVEVKAKQEVKKQETQKEGNK